MARNPPLVNLEQREWFGGIVPGNCFPVDRGSGVEVAVALQGQTGISSDPPRRYMKGQGWMRPVGITGSNETLTGDVDACGVVALSEGPRYGAGVGGR